MGDLHAEPLTALTYLLWYSDLALNGCVWSAVKQKNKAHTDAASDAFFGDALGLPLSRGAMERSYREGILRAPL